MAAEYQSNDRLLPDDRSMRPKSVSNVSISTEETGGIPGLGQPLLYTVRRSATFQINSRAISNATSRLIWERL